MTFVMVAGAAVVEAVEVEVIRATARSVPSANGIIFRMSNAISPVLLAPQGTGVALVAPIRRDVPFNILLAVLNSILLNSATRTLLLSCHCA
jgi:hypothetical protein